MTGDVLTFPHNKENKEYEAFIVDYHLMIPTIPCTSSVPHIMSDLSLVHPHYVLTFIIWQKNTSNAVMVSSEKVTKILGEKGKYNRFSSAF